MKQTVQDALDAEARERLEEAAEDSEQEKLEQLREQTRYGGRLNDES